MNDLHRHPTTTSEGKHKNLFADRITRKILKCSKNNSTVLSSMKKKIDMIKPSGYKKINKK